MGAQKNRLIKTVHLSTHNIRSDYEIRKQFRPNQDPKKRWSLSGSKLYTTLMVSPQD